MFTVYSPRSAQESPGEPVCFCSIADFRIGCLRWVFHAHGPEGKRLLRRSHQRGEEYCYVSFDLQFPRNNGIWGGHERDVPDEYQHRHQMQIDPIGNRNGPHDLQPSSCKGELLSSECAVKGIFARSLVWHGNLHQKKQSIIHSHVPMMVIVYALKIFCSFLCHPKRKERKNRNQSQYRGMHLWL